MEDPPCSPRRAWWVGGRSCRPRQRKCLTKIRQAEGRIYKAAGAWHASTRRMDHATFVVNPCFSLPGLCETLRIVRTAQTRSDHPRIMRTRVPARSISCKTRKSNLIARRAMASPCPIVAQPRSFIDTRNPDFGRAFTQHRRSLHIASDASMPASRSLEEWIWKRQRSVCLAPLPGWPPWEPRRLRMLRHRTPRRPCRPRRMPICYRRSRMPSR